jgi:predicted nucleotidyltransferase
MGRVFRFSEIERREVPMAHDFKEGRQEIVSIVEQTDDIIGAIMCGSVLHGTANLRSDIDLVVYYRPNPEAEKAISRMRYIAESRHLDLNIVPVDTEIAGTRFHTLQWGFLQHLELSARSGGLIKENFLDKVRTDFLDPVQCTVEYISFKLRYLGKSIDEFKVLDHNSEKHMEILQKALELPVHVARKYCWLEGIDTGDDSKVSVAAAYAMYAPYELGEKLKTFCRLDSFYTEAVKKQLKFPDAEAYQFVLEVVAAEMGQIKDFVRQNALLLQKMTEPVVQPEPEISIPILKTTPATI